MKQYLLLGFCLLLAIPGYGQLGVPASGQMAWATYGQAYKDARFPGGSDSMYAFVKGNMHYPAEAVDVNIEGRVILQLMIAADGAIGDIAVPRGIGGGCDEEAVRIVRAMPRWEPAMYKGKPVASVYRLMLKFKLD